jgi:curved DNA-binding protein CbpA
MEERDYYEVLQLHPSADHAMIVQAYWHLARKYKTAMERDGSAEHAVEELNRSFDVLGSPESRAAYDRARATGQTPDGPPQPETRRVSIEVCFWSLPPWQGILAASATVALAAVALASGGPPALVLGLAAVATLAALLVLPSGLFQGAPTPLSRRWRRSRTIELEKSTSQVLARWRRANRDSDGAMPLLDFSEGVPATLRPPGKPPLHLR